MLTSSNRTVQSTRLAHPERKLPVNIPIHLNGTCLVAVGSPDFNSAIFAHAQFLKYKL